jgi:predicted acetyltransferase
MSSSTGNIDVRLITPGELEDILVLDERTFGVTYSDEDRRDLGTLLELDRQLVAVDGPEVVGSAGAWTFETTVPGGAFVPTAGVTWVSVSASHRRRGILRSMMARQLDDIAAGGEPIATLTASESVIYGRFGYGLATFRTKLVVDPRRVRFRSSLGDDGLVRYADPATARKTLPGLYDQMRAQQPGTVNRTDAWWDFMLLDRETQRGGATPYMYGIHPDGYVIFRMANERDGSFMANRVLVRELVGVTPAAHASLWRFVLGLDLVGEVEWNRCSRHEVLPWLVDDHRRVRTTAVDDDVWLRLVDIEAAFTARRYLSSDRLVVDVVDPFRPATSGRYEIDGSPDGATCRRTTAEADLALDVADLGSLYLGGVAATTLGRAGRVEERTPGALRRADAFFASDPPPHNQTSF